MVTKPTHDSGTLWLHVHVTPKVSITTDLSESFYSYQDYVLYPNHMSFTKCN